MNALFKRRCIAFFLTANATATVTLANKGKSDYRIIIPLVAIPSERYAAEELRRYLEKISGAKIPIVTDAEKTAPREILLGSTFQSENS